MYASTSMTSFLLIRHGLTDDVGRVLSGTATGVHLNVVGSQQVQQTADALRDVMLAAVVSSPLERAFETAQAIAAPHALTIEIDDALREFEDGEWTSLVVGAVVVGRWCGSRWSLVR